MTIQIDIKHFFKTQWKKVIYFFVGLLTLVLALVLMLWASKGSGETVTLQATAQCTDATRYEYLVGQTVDTSTVTMQLPNGEVLTNEQYETKADFSSAGLKVVKLSYTEGNTIYEASYGVEVFAVRHLDIRDNTIEKDRHGEWDFSDLIIWAELSGPSREFYKPEQFSGIDDTAIVLDETLFTATVAETEHKDFYVATITCANRTVTYSFTPNPDALVQDMDRILSFVNESDTGEKLTLYVQNNSNNFVAPNGSTTIDVSGTYILESATGEKIAEYKFNYTINGWASEFKSVTNGEGLTDSMDNEDMLVTVNGITFRAGKLAWHKAVLNMNG